ncbi:MAG: D-arabinose 5-phosphate isomerase [Gammaproteobacteria bacterium]|nr:MAG: D-arabinose 5-phosphate isomerase [Gammaproteobacteria bacterium]
MNQEINIAPKQLIQHAKHAIEIEISALKILSEEIDERFQEACQTILNCQGRVVITGMGKSGLVGRKIAATFASTGTPSFFMHPGEAGHGDLGMLVAGDVLIAISNSGNSDEINTLLPVIKRLQIPLISISRDTRGSLPKAANITLTLGKSDEACPLGLAPTSSTTATLAIGDALAVALVYARGFTSEDFAMSHPAGALGKKLLTKVVDLMYTDADNLPQVRESATLEEALFSMTGGRLGMTVIVDDDKKVKGIFTDGDLRRGLKNNINMTTKIANIMTKNPKTVAKNMRASDALTIMNKKGVMQLLVLTDDGKLDGVVSMHDLVQAGVK